MTAVGFRRLSRRLIGGTALFVTLGVMPGWAAPARGAVEFAPVLRVAPIEPGEGTTGLLAGPIFFYERRPSRLEWGVRPLLSWAGNREDGNSEFDLLYPFLSHRITPLGRHGQVLQLIRWSTDTIPDRPTASEWMLFPLMAYQSATPEFSAGFALFPIYGSLHRLLGQDRLQFTLFPLWLSLERNQVIRRFVLWPFFAKVTAASDTAPPAHGWRFWPFYGELIQEGIKEDRFVLWPFFVRQRYNLNTDEPLERTLLFPFYYSRSPDESSVWWLWPFISHIVNTKTHYEEWDLPWPLIQFGSGDEKRIRRLFPFYSEVERTRTVNLFGTNEKVQVLSSSILWPLYHATSEIGPDWRSDHVLLFLLYSDVRTKKAKAPETGRRIDLWPLFTYNKTPDGVVRFQTLAPIEPFLNTEPITRNYSPLWSLATYSRNQDASEFSLLWGLFRWTATGREERLRFFFLPSIHWTRSGPPDATGPPGAPDSMTPAPESSNAPPAPADPVGVEP